MGRSPFLAKLLLFSVLGALSLAPPPAARAQGPAYGGDGYQQELIESTLSRTGLKPDPKPEGKVIERILIVPHDVILEREPWPTVLNWFHTTTKPEVIERELLFREGDRWSDERIVESARNLRNYLFITAGRIIAVQGSSPDRVIAVIVTKDLWSLRLNTEFSYVGSTLERLQLELAEHNLGGRMKRATVDFGLDIASWYAGQQYNDPRLLGSQLSLSERGDLIWNRSSGALEGGLVSLSLQKPLYTLNTPWGWVGAIQYRKDIYRLFTGGEIAQVLSPSTGQTLPYAIDRKLLDLNLGVTRSYGYRQKHNFSMGYRAFIHDYGLPTPEEPVSPVTVTDVSSLIEPISEDAGMLYFGYRTYEANFRELMDIQSFAVTEDLRLGLDFSAEVRVASRIFGFSSTFAQPLVSVSWSGLGGDDLLTASASFDVRYQPELSGEYGSDWVNGEITARLSNVSPRFSLFRLHTQLTGVRRFNSVDRDFSSLGSNTSLRGYPSSYFYGSNLWVGNVEARTLPLAVATVHLGLAAFFDVGGAANELSQMGAHPSTGLGLRVGLPQFNREVLRLDVGFPLETAPGVDPAYFVAQFGQAF